MFKEDIKIGLRFEDFVSRVCCIKFGLKVSKNGNKYGVDLISEQGYTLEVKYDRKFRQSGNFFIEYLYKGNRSGILKYPAGYFVYGDENEFWIFDRVELWHLCLAWGTKKVGGDNNNSTGMLIEYKDIKDLAIYHYKRCKNI